MYEDKKKSKKVYVESKCVSRDDCCWDETPDNDIVESKCVSRDDCCWDETPDTTEVVTVNDKSDQQEQWPAHWTRQL